MSPPKVNLQSLLARGVVTVPRGTRIRTKWGTQTAESLRRYRREWAYRRRRKMGMKVLKRHPELWGLQDEKEYQRRYMMKKRSEP